MLRDYLLYAALALLVVILLWIRRVATRRLRRIRLEKMRSKSASSTLMSTIRRSTPVSARNEMRSSEADSHLGDPETKTNENWVRAPNSITGGRWRDSD